MFPFVAWVLMATHVVPGPTIKATFLHVSDVIGRQVAAQTIALIHRAPHLAVLGVNGDPDTVTNTGSVNALVLSFGGELQHVGAMELRLIIVGIVDVGTRPDRDEHPFTVERESNIARPVA